MEWLTRDAALLKLGVKAQTLYAYVSRGQIVAETHPDDPRTSLYSGADIDKLITRRRRGRSRANIAADAIAWGDPVMETRLTSIKNGALFYHGENAVDLSAHAALEEIAELLWRSDLPHPFAGPSSYQGVTGKARVLSYLSHLASNAEPLQGQTKAQMIDAGEHILRGMANAVCGEDEIAPFHRKLARHWALSEQGEDAIRRALVLVADHELNPSTFAARVTASTGASLAACVVAGCATLTGPNHGEAASLALETLRNVLRGKAINAEGDISGIGHPLYPVNGDPRAKSLINAVDFSSDISRALSRLEERGKANIDLALAAITQEFDLPEDAPFLIFASGRTIGWIAHAIEQALSGAPIRPRAKYLGL